MTSPACASSSRLLGWDWPVNTNQFWHHIEHFVLLYQATTHHYWFHAKVPTSFLQIWIPRVELHLFYNTIVFIPMVVAMYYHMFPPKGEVQHLKCTCARNAREMTGAAAA